MEEWPLSICLLHARHPGGRCTAVSFANNRPTDNSILGRIDGASNRSFDLYSGLDNPDVALYAAVRERFYREVAALGLNADKCASICPAFGRSPVQVPILDTRRHGVTTWFRTVINHSKS